MTEDRNNGLPLGRDHRFTIDWEAVLELRNDMQRALAGGVTTSLALDPHGKTRSSLVLDLPISVPDEYVPPRVR